ncbi:MAG: phage tail assembly protein [Janthinobacterium lividum]
MENEKTITLRKPIELGGMTYAEITLREPVAKELSVATKVGNEVDMTMSLIAQIAKMPMKAVEQLCQRDLAEASECLAGFSADGPPIGEMSSPT